MSEKFKPGSVEGKSGGETWGEIRKRIVLEKVKVAGASGFAVADVLPTLRRYVYDHERKVGNDPDKLGDDVVNSDDEMDVLMELDKEGVVEIKEGRIYLWNEEDDAKPLEVERTREEMRGELREYIEMREFPNRMKVMKFKEAIDIDGNPIPSGITLFYDPREPVRMRGETIYGQYGDEKGNRYWIKSGDADYGASRAHGYTKARP